MISPTAAALPPMQKLLALKLTASQKRPLNQTGLRGKKSAWL